MPKTTSENNLQHLAIIMDGNSRWAKANGKVKLQGHKAGAEAARNILKPVAKAGIKYLTLYAFSSENWQRPQDEVSDLMNLLKYYLGNEVKTLHKNNICLKIIGDRSKLSKDIIKKIDAAEKLTENNTLLTLILALSYGGRQEVIEACKASFLQILESENTKIDKKILDKKFTQELINNNLYTAKFPEPDLLIRTGGDLRVSNFLLWQIAYTELYFTEVLWPDFNAEELENAIKSYSSRQRRFGAR
jgi:undecaprenyl diphosphate synthase